MTLPALLLLSLLALPAAAQDQPLPPRRPAPPDMQRPAPPEQPNKGLGQRLPQARPPVLPQDNRTAAPKGPPPLPSDPEKRREALFERLRDPENAAEARKAQSEIEKLFEQSGSATTNLMLARARQALAKQDADLALDLLDFVTRLSPRFAEGYHRRALVHLLRKDEEAALRDLKATLALEPRHFPALAALAMILRQGGDKKGAYRALARLREISPHQPDLEQALEHLRPDVEGQPI